MGFSVLMVFPTSFFNTKCLNFGSRPVTWRIQKTSSSFKVAWQMAIFLISVMIVVQTICCCFPDRSSVVHVFVHVFADLLLVDVDKVFRLITETPRFFGCLQALLAVPRAVASVPRSPHVPAIGEAAFRVLISPDDTKWFMFMFMTYDHNYDIATTGFVIQIYSDIFRMIHAYDTCTSYSI